jgi:hypothetical protein
VDFLRPRAVPALAFAVACGAAAAADDCSAIAGTYRNADSGKPSARHLDYLASVGLQPDPRITKVERTHVTVRPKITHFAETVTLEARPEGLGMQFRDAKGVALADHIANWPHPWVCKGGSYEWSEQIEAGLGDKFVQIEERQVLMPGPAGDLLLVIERNDPRDKPPQSRKEYRFQRAK